MVQFCILPFSLSTSKLGILPCLSCWWNGSQPYIWNCESRMFLYNGFPHKCISLVSFSPSLIYFSWTSRIYSSILFLSHCHIPLYFSFFFFISPLLLLLLVLLLLSQRFFLFSIAFSFSSSFSLLLLLFPFFFFHLYFSYSSSIIVISSSLLD